MRQTFPISKPLSEVTEEIVSSVKVDLAIVMYFLITILDQDLMLL